MILNMNKKITYKSTLINLPLMQYFFCFYTQNNDWLIDYIVFYAVSAIIQPYNGSDYW